MLKKGVPFNWYEIVQSPFDALKTTLISAPFLHPPNYRHDYFLYLAISDATIGMVLLQDDDDGNEYIIY